VAYVTVEELLAWLKVGSPTQLQLEAAQRALDAAASEIDWELGYGYAGLPFPDPVPELVQQVNLERAEEHWNHAQNVYGVIGLGSEAPIVPMRDSWYRHARKLASLKVAWGVA
jgi:hypothetical protein